MILFNRKLLIVTIFCQILIFSGQSISNPLYLKTDRVKVKFQMNYAASARLKAWKALLSDKSPRKMTSLLKTVNDFFNRLNYVSDSQLKQRADVWLTPYEFLADGGGDCEDFAIAKYFTLVIMGAPEEKLRITYVMIHSRNLAHMVLTYYPTPNSEPYILDNLTNKILKASERSDLVPVYSFNRGKSWLNDRIGRSREYGSPSDLEKWRSLLYRLKLEEEN